MLITFSGAIIARYRVVNPFWFKLHYFIQSLAGILIFVGVGLGRSYTHKLDTPFHTQHKVRIHLTYLISAQQLTAIALIFPNPRRQ